MTRRAPAKRLQRMSSRTVIRNDRNARSDPVREGLEALRKVSKRRGVLRRVVLAPERRDSPQRLHASELRVLHNSIEHLPPVNTQQQRLDQEKSGQTNDGRYRRKAEEIDAINQQRPVFASTSRVRPRVR